VLSTHAEGSWLGQTSQTEKSDFKPIEPLAASTAEALSTSVGSAEGSAEHRTLKKKVGFNYRQVLGELTYAYVVGRVDISHAVALLARYSSAPYRCHYLALKACTGTFDALSFREYYTGDKHCVTFYLPVTARSCLSTTNIYPSSRSSAAS
jgi:hypothetical protein